MIDFIHKDAYWQDSIDKQLKIELEDGTIIDNSMIYSEEFELEENLCSDDTLRFGSCEASCVKFRIFAIPNSLVGQKINISEVVGSQTDNPMQIGKYKIVSVTPTADRDCIDIVAYDSMYDIIHSDVAEWYNNQFKATTTTETDTEGNTVNTTTYSKTTLKKFRDSFFSHFGIEQVGIDLPNDNTIVSKTIEIVPNTDGAIGETLSGSSVIEAICEINGCFGHINRDGKFEYVFLQPIAKELFPSDDLFPSNDLFPTSDNVGVVIYNWQYEPVEYEDYDVQPITQVRITQEENDIGITVGEDGNKYIVDSNFLTYSLSDEELKEVGTNILSEVRKAKYTPIKANVIGNPCIMLGDIIKIVTNTKILYSYVLNRTLSGCQSLTDDIEAKGEEYRSVDVNSTNAQIKKLQGRSNVLERSIDETRSTITNVEIGLKSEIKQTADSITQEIENRKSEDNVLSSKIEQTADSIISTVSATQGKWDVSGYEGKTIFYGYNDAEESGVTAQADTYYVNVVTGHMWYARHINTGGYVWDTQTFLRTIQNATNSKIEQTAENIKSTISATQSKWDVSYYINNGYTITYGYSEPVQASAPQSMKQAYIDVSTGFSYETNYVQGNNKYMWQGRGYQKEIKDVLQSSIDQTAESITAEVSRATEAEGELSSKIEETADSINLSVDTKLEAYSTKEETNSAIKISKDSIESTVAKNTVEWDMDNIDGGNITPDYARYGVKVNYGNVSGDTSKHYYTTDIIMKSGEYLLDQINGILYKCTGVDYILPMSLGQQASLVDTKWTLSKKTDELESAIEQYAGEIVLKVDKGGRIVQVALSSDAEEGTSFTVDADNIDLTATDIFNIISGNTLNLTSKKVSINSTNFSVDEDGNMKCNNGEFSGRVKGGDVVGSTIWGDYELYLCKGKYNPSGEQEFLIALRSGTISTVGTGYVLYVGSGFQGVVLPITVFIGDANSTAVKTTQTIDISRKQIDEIHGYSNIGSGMSFNFVAGGLTYSISASTSDTKLKENIVESEQTSLDKIRRIQFIQFDWKENKSHVPLGVSANQLGEIIPQAVLDVPQPDDSEYDTLKNVDVFTMLNYSLKAIQEMDELIQDQKKEIGELKSALQKLTERMDKYEQSI